MLGALFILLGTEAVSGQLVSRAFYVVPTAAGLVDLGNPAPLPFQHSQGSGYR